MAVFIFLGEYDRAGNSVSIFLATWCCVWGKGFRTPHPPALLQKRPDAPASSQLQFGAAR